MGRREEAENASELMTAGTDDGSIPAGAWIENDALGVHGTQIRRYIRNFDDA